MKILRLLDSYSEKSSRFLANLSGWAVFIMMCVVVADILMVSTRFGSIAVKVELVQMMMIVAVFGGLAFSDVLGKHAVATIFTDRLPPKWKAVCNVISYGMATFICVIFTWQVILYAQHMTEIKKNCLSSDLPYYPFTWFSVIGFILLDARYVVRLGMSFREVFKKRS